MMYSVLIKKDHFLGCSCDYHFSFSRTVLSDPKRMEEAHRWAKVQMCGINQSKSFFFFFFFIPLLLLEYHFRICKQSDSNRYPHLHTHASDWCNWEPQLTLIKVCSTTLKDPYLSLQTIIFDEADKLFEENFIEQVCIPHHTTDILAW